MVGVASNLSYYNCVIYMVHRQQQGQSMWVLAWGGMLSTCHDCFLLPLALPTGTAMESHTYEWSFRPSALTSNPGAFDVPFRQVAGSGCRLPHEITWVAASRVIQVGS
jgi:hypothetical protein